MKTFDKKDVYSWSNAEEAKQYIGKEGYFSNNFSGLQNKVRNCYELSILENIDNYGICCFNTKVADGFGLFLPADKVKEVEDKKRREFRTFEEFALYLGTIGCNVRFRKKGDINQEYLSVISSFNFGARTVTIGARIYNFAELFKGYEWRDEDGEWHPFGVEE